MTSSDYIFEFGAFRLDPELRILTKNRRRRNLTEKPFDLLLFLIQNRHRVVSNAELGDGGWTLGSVQFSNQSINQHFSKIYRALGEDRRERYRFIERRDNHARFFADVKIVQREPEKPLVAGIPSSLCLNGFAQPRPAWVSKECFEQLRSLAAASLFLLAYERSATGCWSKTYLYRKRAGKSKEPLAGGSLAGTPYALTAIGSITDELAGLSEWISTPLRGTLARLGTEDGQYIATLDSVNTASSSSPAFEPPRHVAGGLLIKLLLSATGQSDVATADMLAQIPSQMLPMAWDKATVFRAVVHARFDDSMPPKIKTKLNTQAKHLLSLLTGPHSGSKIMDLWADGFGYGDGRISQWVTAWSLLPALHRLPTIPQSATQKLRELLTDFLLAQSACVQPSGLFARSVDRSGHLSGDCVFGTALAVACWRSLELTANSESESQRCVSEASSVLKRILSTGESVIRVPAWSEGSPIEIEGYVGWAGLLLCAGSCGVRFASGEAMRIIALAEALGHQTEDLETHQTELGVVFGHLAPGVLAGIQGINRAELGFR